MIDTEYHCSWCDQMVPIDTHVCPQFWAGMGASSATVRVVGQALKQGQKKAGAVT